MVDVPDTGERRNRDLGRNEAPTSNGYQLPHGHAVARHEKRFAPIQLTHYLPALVAQLPLCDLTHEHIVAPVPQTRKTTCNETTYGGCRFSCSRRRLVVFLRRVG